MKRIIDTSEVLGTVEMPTGVWEVCALADAGYDEEKGHVVVRLDACLRTTDLLKREERVKADWLPAAQTVEESVPLEEADDVAHDIFARWVRKVRQAAPPLHGPTL